MSKQTSKMQIKENKNQLIFEVIVRPTTNANGERLNWGYGRVRYEDREQIKHLNDFFPGINRDVNPKHVEKLKESIEKHGFAGGIMVGIIQNNMICGDANHRWYGLVAAKRDIPIIYADFDTIEEFMEFVITTNNSGKNWGTDQYISTYKVMRHKPYETLLELKKTFHFSNTVMVALMAGLDIGTAKTALKTGAFKLIEKSTKGYELRVETAWGFSCGFVTKLSNNKSKLKPNNQRIGEAIILLLNHIQSQAKFKQMYHEIAERSASKFKGQRTTKEFAKLFIDAYDSII